MNIRVNPHVFMIESLSDQVARAIIRIHGGLDVAEKNGSLLRVWHAFSNSFVSSDIANSLHIAIFQTPCLRLSVSSRN